MSETEKRPDGNVNPAEDDQQAASAYSFIHGQPSDDEPQVYEQHFHRVRSIMGTQPPQERDRFRRSVKLSAYRPGQDCGVPADPFHEEPAEDPEWLKVARQNNYSVPPQSPENSASAREYNEAGYPPELMKSFGLPVSEKETKYRAPEGSAPRRRSTRSYTGAFPHEENDTGGRPVNVYKPAGISMDDPFAGYTDPLRNQNTEEPYAADPFPDEEPCAADPFPADEPAPAIENDQFVHRSSRARNYTQAVASEDGRSRNTETDQDTHKEHKIDLFSWVRAAAVLLILAVGVCVACGYWFSAQKQVVLDNREKEHTMLLNTHPLEYRAIIEQTAKRYNIAPAFVAALVLNESSFRPNAVSSVDARGLMQLMDNTAGWIHGKMGLTSEYSFAAMTDPETNVEYGCWYLNYLSDLFGGDAILVSAAYHAGQGEIRNWLNTSAYSPDHRTLSLDRMPEGPTRQYATRVTRDYAIYQALYYEDTDTVFVRN